MSREKEKEKESEEYKREQEIDFTVGKNLISGRVPVAVFAESAIPVYLTWKII